MEQKNCIFCQIISGKIPARVVYDDTDFLGFLDINPLSPGHTLLIPKKHVETILDLPENLAEKVLKVAKAISTNMKKIGATGVNLVNASGRSAEQSIPHFHLHIIPRNEEDDVNLNVYWQSKVKKLDPNTFNEIAQKIKTESLKSEVIEKSELPKSNEKRRSKKEIGFIKRELMKA